VKSTSIKKVASNRSEVVPKPSFRPSKVGWAPTVDKTKVGTSGKSIASSAIAGKVKVSTIGATAAVWKIDFFIVCVV